MSTPTNTPIAIPNSLGQTHTNRIVNYFTYGNVDAGRRIDCKSYLKASDEELQRWHEESASSPGHGDFTSTATSIRQMFCSMRSWWPNFVDNDVRQKAGKYLMEAQKITKWAKECDDDEIRNHANIHYIPFSGPTRDRCIVFLTKNIV